VCVYVCHVFAYFAGRVRSANIYSFRAKLSAEGPKWGVETPPKFSLPTIYLGPASRRPAWAYDDYDDDDFDNDYGCDDIDNDDDADVLHGNHDGDVKHDDQLANDGDGDHDGDVKHDHQLVGMVVVIIMM